MRPIDRLEVLVLVDNATDSLSTTPKFVIPEWPALQAAGRLPTLSGEVICRAHHGLSLLLTAHVDGERHTLLFDAGPAGSTLTQNAAILGVDFGEVEAVVLSLIGGLTGLLLGLGLIRVLTQALGWSMELPLSAVIAAVGTSGGIGIVFGFVPARRAARLDPIVALKNE